MEPNEIYKRLLNHFGKQHWWPRKGRKDPRFEIIVGAILTQNTSWNNVEKALENLEEYLTIKDIKEMDVNKLRELIKPSGFFNQKAERLKIVASHLHRYGNLDRFFNRNLEEIREELLSLKGIGPETADSILLYAGEHPIFVVDAYTKQLCKRLPIPVNLSYEEIQCYFQENLEKDVETYKELHALIVKLGKTYCKKKPKCGACPLSSCNYKKEKNETK
jgi:endonuclease-3 related protein